MNKLNIHFICMNARGFSMGIRVILTMLVFLSCTNQKKYEPVAKNGILDLRSWDFEKDGKAELKGEWKFAWMSDRNEYKLPNFPDIKWANIEVPSIWGRSTNTSRGFGWLRLHLILDSISGLGLYIKECHNSYELYINGERHIQVGNPGNTKEKTIHRKLHRLIQLPPSAQLTFSWKIANFVDIYGGPTNAPVLCRYDELKTSLWHKDLLEMVIIGIILMAVFYHFIIWVRIRKDRASFYFTLFGLIIISRLLTNNNYLERFFFDFNSYELRIKIEYLTVPLCWVVYIKFLDKLFPKSFNRNLIKLSQILAYPLVLFILATPSLIYSNILPVLHLIILLLCIWLMLNFVSGLRRGLVGSWPIVIGFVILVISVISDILYSNMVNPVGFLSHFGFLIFVLSQSSVITRRFAEAYRRIEQLTDNLQLEVDFKTKELKEANNKLWKLDQHKTRFYQNITHEFRTPLTLIIEPLRSLFETQDFTLPDKVKGHLSLIQKNAQKLLQLVNQILDLVKLDAGKMKVNLQPVDLLQYIKAQISVFENYGDKRNISIHLISSENSILVNIDIEKFEKVLINLLSNALKFSKDNSKIEVHIELVNNKNALQDSVEITIKDFGEGIPQEEIPRVFNRFYQAMNQSSRVDQGTGIGLAIVREYIKLHHGEIKVKSEPNKGSEFIIKLPFTKPETNRSNAVTVSPKINSENIDIFEGPDDGNVAALPEDDSEKTYRLLLVEDNKEMREYIVSSLSEYDIYQAGDGAKALEIAIDYTPDLIVSDIMMPEMDGITLCRKLKADERTNHIPIILLTAKADAESEMQGLEKGAEDYIAKPFNMNLLKTRISNLLKIKEEMKGRYLKRILLEPTNSVVHACEGTFIQGLLNCIENSITDYDFDVEVLADRMGMSSSSLYRKIKNVLGQSPSELIRIIRLKSAAQIMEYNSDPGLTVSEVACKTGFKESSHFSKLFKKQYQLSPKEYIKKFLAH